MIKKDYELYVKLLFYTAIVRVALKGLILVLGCPYIMGLILDISSISQNLVNLVSFQIKIKIAYRPMSHHHFELIHQATLRQLKFRFEGLHKEPQPRDQIDLDRKCNEILTGCRS